MPLLIHGGGKLGFESEDEFDLFCSRYVFAPICRGVTSKRSTIPANPESESYYQNHPIVLDSILEQIKHKYEEQEAQDQETEHDPDYSW